MLDIKTKLRPDMVSIGIFKKWFIDTYPNINFKTFIETNNFEMQLGVFIKFFEEVYSIQIGVLDNCYGIFYIKLPDNPILSYICKKNVNVITEGNSKVDGILENYYEGIIQLFNLLETPF